MNYLNRLRVAECGAVYDTPPSAPTRRGLTLIELLVTIVIMVTVLAGALPLLSPNNNARKIREASRQLTTLFAQAQAQAARDGRPVGIAFRELGTSSPFSGMSTEAFMIASPPPFAGYSEQSQVRFRLVGGSVREVQFVVAGVMIADPSVDPDNCYPLDEMPPNLLRYGDPIRAVSTTFVLMDPDQDGDGDPDIKPDGEFKPGDPYRRNQLAARYQCRIVSDLTRDPNVPLPPPTNVSPMMLPVAVPSLGGGAGDGWTSPRAYQVVRQPSNTSETPLQLPRGIGIDLQSSGGEGVNVPGDFDSGLQDVIGVMFSPTGAIDALYMNGVKAEGVNQVYLLLGLFENGSNGSQDFNDFEFSLSTVSDDELAQRRTRVNWLNADCRWVTINRAGRIITSENNTSFDPRRSPYIDDLTGTTPEDKAHEQRQRHIDGYSGSPGARLHANRMNASTGR